MAISSVFTTTKGIRCAIAVETTIGSGTPHADATWDLLPLTSMPTFSEASLDLDMGSGLNGQYTQSHIGAKQRRDSLMEEIQIEFVGFSGYNMGFKHLFNNSASPLIDSLTIPQTWVDGATNSNASKQSFVILLGGVGVGGGDLKYKGCIVKEASVSHSIDSNSGFPIVSMTFVTGYKHTIANSLALYADGGATLESEPIAVYENESAKHLSTLNCLVGKHVGETIGSSNYDARCLSYNISISREIERIGYKDTTNYNPYSYAQTGMWKISGDVTIKRDTNFNNIDNYITNNEISGFIINGTSPTFQIALNGKVNGNSVEGDSYMKNTISFEGLGNDTLSLAFASTADGGGGTKTIINSPNHGLGNGQKITISSSTSLNGDYIVSDVTDDTFKVTNSWSSSSETGTWTLHADSSFIAKIIL